MIREARKSDIPILLHMGEKFFLASGLSNITSYDRESTKETFIMLISSGTLLVGEINGSVVGMIGAVLYPFYFNKNHVTGQEMFWWVNEEHRKSSVGSNLLDAIEKKAAKMGATSFTMISLENINPEYMDRIYKMKKYLPSEYHYHKRLT